MMEQPTLFDTPPRRVAPMTLPLGHRITCRVHGLPAPAHDDGVLLCASCRADPAAAREHCEETLTVCAARADAAGQAWLDAQSAADDATLSRMRQAERLIAQGQDRKGAFVRLWQREKAQGTALGTLIEAYEAYTVAMRQIATLRRGAEQGLVEVAALEDV